LPTTEVVAAAFGTAADTVVGCMGTLSARIARMIAPTAIHALALRMEAAGALLLLLLLLLL